MAQTRTPTGAAIPAADKKVAVHKPKPIKPKLNKTGEAKSGAASKAKKAKSKVKSKVGETASDVRSQAADAAKTAATKGKSRATETISGISSAIRDSAGNIDQSVGEGYGDYARTAADKVDSWAEMLDNKDVEELMDDAREFVRQRPAVAIGAAAVAGFALMRLLRSGRDI